MGIAGTHCTGWSIHAAQQEPREAPGNVPQARILYCTTPLIDPSINSSYNLSCSHTTACQPRLAAAAGALHQTDMDLQRDSATDNRESSMIGKSPESRTVSTLAAEVGQAAWCRPVDIYATLSCAAYI